MFEKYDCILSDFDGTISKYDVIHTFISTYSKGNWREIERQWCRGEISSKKCFDLQFKILSGIKKKDFVEFINSVEIDPYFISFFNRAKAENKKIIVVSDGCDVFIENILKRYDITLPIFANKLNVKEKEDKLYFSLEYPNISKKCEIHLGCCKCEIAKTFGRDFIYIGDGLSDRCISKKASKVFAKKHLKDYLENKNIPYNSFETFKDILDKLSKSLV